MARIRGDLLDRTFELGCRILELAAEFPNDARGRVVGKQVIRSGTSNGADVCEADQPSLIWTLRTSAALRGKRLRKQAAGSDLRWQRSWYQNRMQSL